MNWLDTQLLVYVSIDGHPAQSLLKTELMNGDWGSTNLALTELYHVLIRNYQVGRADAREMIELLANSAIQWTSVNLDRMLGMIALQESYRINSVDAALLLLAEEDRGTLVTQDSALLRAAQQRGCDARNPSDSEMDRAIRYWEQSQLPDRGSARLLRFVGEWIGTHDRGLAVRFREETANHSRLPF